MKTSNKILIAFATALILIPLLGMVIVCATQYKTGTYEADVLKIENFSTPTKNMVSIALTSPFQSVSFADAKGIALSVHLIKDDKFGIKIQDKFKDLISATVDANGQLQIVIKDKSKAEERRYRYYTDIYVYAPTIKSLNVTNANDMNIMAVTDTLSLSIQKSTGISFDSETHIKQLNLKAVDVERLSFREDDIKSINLDLDKTKLYIESNSFDNAAITTRGNCEVEIGAQYGDDKKQTINNLVLNTNGIAIIKVENTIIKNCTGKLSDETQVQMAAANLNQMYKK